MGYNKIALYGNQICDYLMISGNEVSYEDFKNVNSEPDWNDDTLFLAKFNNNLVAGNTDISDNIVGYTIRRKKGGSPYTEHIGTINQSVGDTRNKFMIDYSAVDGVDYTYYLYPSSGSKTMSPLVSKDVTPSWAGFSLIIVDDSNEDNVYYVNKIFNFELNIHTEDMSNNSSASVVQNFTKYPTVQQGTSNYWSGSLSSLCGFIGVNDSEYIQTPNMISELKNITSDTRKKFLKDFDGNIFEVEITSPVSISTDNITLQRIKTVKIGWTEVGSTSNVSIINNPDIPTTSWILTETGEAVPYVEYIWDSQYIWDNSYRWTSNDNVLDTSDFNMGREVVAGNGGDTE